MKIKKGDTVQVLSGNARGKKGKVLTVYPDQNRAIVEGVNFMKRHTRPSQKYPQGGVIEREAPIHISNLMMVVDGKPTRIGYQRLEGGKKVRYGKKTGETINE
ncbi:MAG: 50S ribosomal protein L24 [Candidatus Marinimicrobia bacterium]|nr:50S ribosomal protein L24 [Candidatus Neomarinimicrobiota bacterium]MCH7858138.1 50S ribosomal protein L24 [Candidatus Neomarinimicrobiota bacterium]